MFSSFGQVPTLNVPQFQTRRALIVINLQNDSLDEQDGLVLTKPQDFVGRIKSLVPYFRQTGDVMWVSTEIEPLTFVSPSPPPAPTQEELVITREQEEKDRKERELEEQQLEDDTLDDGHDDDNDDVAPSSSPRPWNPITYHPTSRSKAMMNRASAQIRAERRAANIDVFNDDDAIDDYLSKPRKGQPPKLYQTGTRGAALADEILPVFNESTDLMLTKHHYSAFDATPLLMSLRMKLITDLYLCGCLSNVSIYATAADAVRHGLNVTVVEDCLGYRSEAKHEDAMRQMADIMGVNGIDSEEIIQESGGREPPDTDTPMFLGPGIDGITLQSLSLGAEQTSTTLADPIDPNTDAPSALVLESEPGVSMRVDPISPLPEPVIGVHTKLEPLPGNELGPLPMPPLAPLVAADSALSGSEPGAAVDLGPISPPAKSVDAFYHLVTVPSGAGLQKQNAEKLSETLRNEITPLHSPWLVSSRRESRRESRSDISNMRVLGPGDMIGEGDARIIHDFLDPTVAEGIFESLKEAVDWQTMHHRGGNVPRLVAVQGEVGKDGSVPLYRHPADESPRLSPFSATVETVREEVEKLLRQPFNHALLQLYRDGNDNISEHSDKTLDIVRGSSIANVSFGAQRAMTLRIKKPKDTRSAEDSISSRRSQRIPLPHNSVFVLGYSTNMRWLHGVRPDKRPAIQKTEDEKSFGGERISITLRHIGTFTEERSNTIWGQGATQKSKSNAAQIQTVDTEMEAMIQAFGKENNLSDFNWDAEYGSGFDVIKLIRNTTELFLCNDPLANLRVQLSLSEKGVPYKTINCSPAASPSTNPAANDGAGLTHPLSNIQNPTFKDIDEDASEIDGDLAILFYLDKYYPSPLPPSASSRQLHRATARVYSRATQSNEILFLWRELQRTSPNAVSSIRRLGSEKARPITPNTSTLEEFRGDLEMWEEYAGEAEFIAGEFWTIIDCAFWPVLNEIIGGWQEWGERKYPDLMGYYRRVLGTEWAKGVLGAEKEERVKLEDMLERGG